MGKHAQGTQRGHRLDGGRVAGQRGLAHGAQSTGLGKEAARTWRERAKAKETTHSLLQRPGQRCVSLNLGGT